MNKGQTFVLEWLSYLKSVMNFIISEQSKILCEKLLNNEITFEEYLAFALKQAGVNA